MGKVIPIKKHSYDIVSEEFSEDDEYFSEIEKLLDDKFEKQYQKLEKVFFHNKTYVASSHPARTGTAFQPQQVRFFKFRIMSLFFSSIIAGCLITDFFNYLPLQAFFLDIFRLLPNIIQKPFAITEPDFFFI